VPIMDPPPMPSCGCPMTQASEGWVDGFDVSVPLPADHSNISLLGELRPGYSPILPFPENNSGAIGSDKRRLLAITAAKLESIPAGNFPVMQITQRDSASAASKIASAAMAAEQKDRRVSRRYLSPGVSDSIETGPLQDGCAALPRSHERRRNNSSPVRNHLLRRENPSRPVKPCTHCVGPSTKRSAPTSREKRLPFPLRPFNAVGECEIESGLAQECLFCPISTLVPRSMRTTTEPSLQILRRGEPRPVAKRRTADAAENIE